MRERPVRGGSTLPTKSETDCAQELLPLITPGGIPYPRSDSDGSACSLLQEKLAEKRLLH